jgi:hypothetical protein
MIVESAFNAALTRQVGEASRATPDPIACCRRRASVPLGSMLNESFSNNT